MNILLFSVQAATIGEVKEFCTAGRENQLGKTGEL